MTNTVVCIGTAPSLTMYQVDVARQKGFRLFGCNNVVFEDEKSGWPGIPDLELLYGCNLCWWEEYYNRVKDHPCPKPLKVMKLEN